MRMFDLKVTVANVTIASYCSYVNQPQVNYILNLAS